MPTGKRTARSGDAAETEEPGGDALWDALRDGHRMVRSELRAVLRRKGMFLSEYRALGRLQDRETTIGELAEELGLAPASMTDLARQLESRKWVVRRRSPTDRRSYLLRVTPAGARSYRSNRTEYRTRLAEVARAMSPRGREGLQTGLDELIRVVARRQAETSGPG